MSLRDKLSDDLKQALKQGDDVRKRTLRYLLSAVHNAEIEKGGPLDDAGTLAVISKHAKQRRESAEEFRKGGRADLVEREEAEAAVLEEYLPPAMSREEIAEAARKVIAETGASGPQDIGKVMPVLMKELSGRAEGREINAVVRELLQSSS
ncbi:MAG: GatB/YqeY domain-containing protein [Dehalococcoidia bacterium]|nr:GatB/YqeY domain-containing protein [Dehalococcoidia bacterium]